MTLTKRIIPCLDVKDGRVVKGVRFENLRDVGDPAELAARYEEEGADEVVFLDISASREGRKTFLDVVQRTAEQLFIPLTVGGGIGSVEDIHGVLRAGADKVSINTAAVRRPEVITEGADQFGRQCIVASVDARRTGDGWTVFTHGGSRETEHDAIAWTRHLVEQRGAGEVLLTSMDCDGTQDGYDLELTRRIVDAVSVPVIASGGAGSLDHLREALVEGGADAALAASIFHDQVYSVGEAKEFLVGAGLAMRLDT